jgi:energy-converting hydrogenase Eha subunit C
MSSLIILPIINVGVCLFAIGYLFKTKALWSIKLIPVTLFIRFLASCALEIIHIYYLDGFIDLSATDYFIFIALTNIILELLATIVFCVSVMHINSYLRTHKSLDKGGGRLRILIIDIVREGRGETEPGVKLA